MTNRIRATIVRSDVCTQKKKRKKKEKKKKKRKEKGRSDVL